MPEVTGETQTKLQTRKAVKQASLHSSHLAGQLRVRDLMLDLLNLNPEVLLGCCEEQNRILLC